MTGVHVVADIHCVACGSVVGWTYVRASAYACGVGGHGLMRGRSLPAVHGGMNTDSRAR